MPANVESMMYVRETPWHGLGTKVDEAPNSADALRLAGLDWTVNQQDVTTNGVVIPGYKANVRSNDGNVLGIVTDRYKIVQNHEAFDFTDSLIGGDVRYDTAGSLRNGEQIWLLAKMPERKIAGDDVEPYLCFTNNHDGKGAIRAIMTPIRVVCQNTLNFALRRAKRSWSMTHTGNIQMKLDEARQCLELADRYMYALDETAQRLANITVTNEQMHEYLNDLFPLDDDASDREKRNVKKARDEMMVAFFAPDLSAFANTAWAAVNAASDMATHSQPLRKSKNYRANNWGRVMGGHPVIDKMMELVTAGVNV